MGLPGTGTDVTSSGLSATMWSLEWTYTDGSGAVLLDSVDEPDGAWTDRDPRVTTPVADGTAGITLITYPKCRRVRVLHCSIEPATPGTASNHRHLVPELVVPSAGTMQLRILAANGGAVNSDPESGSRGRLVLQLEYN